MQTANIILAIAEDIGNTVPKSGVTPAEVSVLMAIHGEGAVTDVDILETTKDVTARQEISDLYFRYGRALNDNREQVVRTVFPTATTPVPQSFADIGLPETAFTPKSLEAMKAPKKAAAKKTAAKSETSDQSALG